MKNQSLFLAALLLSLSLTSSIASAQDVTFETKDVEISKVFRDDALSGTQAWNLVESLTTEVGPRLAGSEAEARAPCRCRFGRLHIATDRLQLHRLGSAAAAAMVAAAVATALRVPVGAAVARAGRDVRASSLGRGGRDCSTRTSLAARRTALARLTSLHVLHG